MASNISNGISISSLDISKSLENQTNLEGVDVLQISNFAFSADGDLVLQLSDGQIVTIEDFAQTGKLSTSVDIIDANGATLDASFFVDAYNALGAQEIQTVQLPAQGLEQIINVSGNTVFRVNVDSTEVATITETDAQLVIIFNSGGRIVFDRDGDIDMALTLDRVQFQDGSTLTQAVQGGDENVITTLAEELNLADLPQEAGLQNFLDDGAELAAIEPAAGNTPSAVLSDGGAFNSSFDAIQVDPLDAVGQIDATALTFEVNDDVDEQALADILNPAAVVTVTPPTVTIDASSLSGNEDTGITPDITAAPALLDGSESITVTISNIPDGVDVDTTQSGGTFDPTTNIFTIDLGPGETFDTPPTFTPPLNSDVDLLDLLITVTTTQTPSGATSTTTETFDIIVDAVADDFDVIAQDIGNAIEDTPFSVGNIVTQLQDTDGSEAVTQFVFRLPNGFSLDGVPFNLSLNGFPVDPADLGNVQVISPNNFKGDIQIEVEAFNAETPTDGETDLTNNTNSSTTTFNVTINADADDPDVDLPGEPGGPAAAEAVEDQATDITLDIAPTDSTEFLTVTISGFPAGSTVDTSLSGGAFNATTGEWTITLGVGETLTQGPRFTPPADSDADVTLAVRVVSTEPSNGDTAIVTDSFTIVVDAAVDDTTLSVSDVSGEEGQGVALNITALLQDTDGSEEFTGFEISSVPSTITFNQGSNLGGGIWSFTPAQINGLEIIQGAGASDATLTLTAFNQEVNFGGQEPNVANNVNSTSVSFAFSADGIPTIIDEGDTGVPNGVDNQIFVEEGGAASVSGQLTVQGGDGVITATEAGTFTVPAGLSSQGVPVTVDLVNGRYVGYTNDVTNPIFVFDIDSDGSYVFRQLDQLDHTGVNDESLLLSFGVQVTDEDGDTDTATIDIRVFDDGPATVPNSNSVNEGESVNGNLISNDPLGFDGDGAFVTQIEINGQTFNINPTGQTVIQGSFGSLIVNANGAYTFTAGNIGQDGQDVFTYTVSDFDGDLSTSTLTVNVAGNAPEIIDEGDTGAPNGVDNLISVEEGGVNTATGQLTVQGGDGVITATETNIFNGPTGLSSNGVPVTVDLVNGQYVGSAGGNTVFTFDIEADGSYTFTQTGPLDHEGANDESFVLSFGVQVSDEDGDTDTANIDIRIFDDEPQAVNDGNQNVDEGDSVSGNLISNDDLGFDANGASVTQVQIGNQTFNVNPTGNTVIQGQFGTLTINAQGAYTYTADNVGQDGQDIFTYTLSDADGDTDTATFSFNVSDNAPEIIDEGDIGTPNGVDNLISVEEGGVNTATGQLTVQGGDGVITATETNTFSIPAGLSSNGVPVTVDIANGQYVGSAGGNTVFTFDIEADGSYTFTQLDQLDHEGANDESFVLSFGVQVSDADGDTDTANIDIRVFDDGPEAVNDVVAVAEGSTRTGNALNNDTLGFDNDGSSITQIQFGNQTFNVNPIGNTVIQGTFGVLTIDAAGNFSYAAGQVDQLEWETFVYTLQDADGDTDTAVLQFDVLNSDTQPIITNEGDTGAFNGVDNQISVQEGGVNTATGQLTVQGGDGVITATETDTFSIPAGLSSNGVPVTVDLINGQYVGSAGGNTVFTFDIEADGSYTFTQLDQLDHEGANGESLLLSFGVQVSDEDGDTDTANIDIRVFDDAPIAVNDVRSLTEGTTRTGNALNNDTLGFDNDGAVITQVQFGNQIFTINPTGNTVIQGQFGVLTIDAAGNYSYAADNVDQTEWERFIYTLQDADGDTDTARLQFDVRDGDSVPVIEVLENNQTIDESNGVQSFTRDLEINFGDDAVGSVIEVAGPIPASLQGLTSNGEAIQIFANGGLYRGEVNGNTIFELLIDRGDREYSFRQFDQIDHPNPNSSNEALRLDFDFVARDGDGDELDFTISVNIRDDGPKAVKDSDTVTDSETSTTGNVLSNDDAGFDDAGSRVTQIQFRNQTVDVPESGTATITGRYGTLEIAADGSYTFTRTGDAGGTDSFKYTLTDGDGDTDRANLRVQVETIVDNVPEITDTGSGDFNGVDSLLSVDETNSINFTNGQVTATGGDGQITFSENNSLLGNTGLTSNGEAITIGLNNGQYIGLAGNRTIFTLNINDDGSYRFTQSDQIDHPDGDDANDSLVLQFGVTATDTDGSSDSDVIQIRVFDDAPDAVNDIRSVNEGSSLSGNVTSNDDVGFDDAGSAVTEITFGNRTFDVPSSGDLTVQGNFGTLTINAQGSYTYRANSVNQTEWDRFEYTLTDGDGDTDTARLQFDVRNIANTAPIANDDSFTVYELDANLWDVPIGSTGIEREVKEYDYGYGWGVLPPGYDPEAELLDPNWEPLIPIAERTVTEIVFETTNGATYHVDSGSDQLGFTFRLPVLQNDRDPDGDPLTITRISNVRGLPPESELFIEPGGQSILIRVGEDGDFNASTVRFDYTISDGNGGTDTATVTVQISDQNSPLVLDLDGDGIELLSKADGVLFDIDNDGQLEQTGFAGPDDGLLALDLNGDGFINSQAELFGNNNIFDDGFQNLASFDGNQDGVIDASDDVFSLLVVWQDSNSDGVSQVAEQLSLEDLGIVSISLDALDLEAAGIEQIIAGNTITDASFFTYEDGTQGSIVDAFFTFTEVEDPFADQRLPEDIEGTIVTPSYETPDGPVADSPEFDNLSIAGVFEDAFDPELQSAIRDFVQPEEGDDLNYSSVNSEVNQQNVVLVETPELDDQAAQNLNQESII